MLDVLCAIVNKKNLSRVEAKIEEPYNHWSHICGKSKYTLTIVNFSI
jgi:hypothetical protein